MARLPSRWGPVAEGERNTTLDALRGVAIFGMLLANIIIFALPAASRGLASGSTGTTDSLVALFEGIFVEGKFYTLFSILFGMGLALQSKRADDLGRPFTRTYLRRIAALAIIGIAHGLLLFSADILAFYAVIALLALPLRRLQPRALLAAAVAVFTAGLLLLGAYAVGDPEGALPSEPDWHELAVGESGAQQTDQPGLSARSSSARVLRTTLLSPVAQRLRVSELELYAFMADEERIFRQGSLSEMIRHRAVTYLVVAMPLRLIFTSLRTLALFLLGMFLVKRTLFFDVERNLRVYKKMLTYGLTYGILLELVGGAAQPFTGVHPLILSISLVGIFTGIPALSLGYAGGVALLCAARSGSSVVRPLAAVGRTALTNYVGQSVICGFIFYGFGLGLFGRISAAQAVLLAVPIFGVQSALSAIWLRYFRFGPLEWLWRTVSYWRIQPMRHLPRR